MNIIRIKSLKTNYIWIIYNNKNDCIIIDPGEYIKILKIIKKLRLTIKSILITHNHSDHTNGILMLLRYFPKIEVYGPLKSQYKNIKITIVGEGDNLILLNKKIQILDLPGHTAYHIGFYCNPYLFCGDTVFSAGCGKVQIGYMQDMYKSILKIKKLPHNTLICCGHEYTLSNINFAASILSHNKLIINYYHRIINYIAQNKPIPITRLSLELKINPFFRCDHIDTKQELQILPSLFEDEWKIFKRLRERKDIFSSCQTLFKK